MSKQFKEFWKKENEPNYQHDHFYRFTTVQDKKDNKPTCVHCGKAKDESKKSSETYQPATDAEVNQLPKCSICGNRTTNPEAHMKDAHPDTKKAEGEHTYTCDEGHKHTDSSSNKNGDYCPDNIPF